ncbi:hypothetical protein BH23GEM8_BH23GEM8_11740 [soil metagenome]
MKSENESTGNVNPSARRDAEGEPHDDLARSDGDDEKDRPGSYQDADRDPRDQGGIAD